MITKHICVIYQSRKNTEKPNDGAGQGSIFDTWSEKAYHPRTGDMEVEIGRKWRRKSHCSESPSDHSSLQGTFTALLWICTHFLEELSNFSLICCAAKPQEDLALSRNIQMILKIIFIDVATSLLQIYESESPTQSLLAPGDLMPPNCTVKTVSWTPEGLMALSISPPT